VSWFKGGDPLGVKAVRGHQADMVWEHPSRRDLLENLGAEKRLTPWGEIQCLRAGERWETVGRISPAFPRNLLPQNWLPGRRK
jgi:hypothetical protein